MNCEDFISNRRKLDLNKDEDPLMCPNTEADKAIEILKEHFLDGSKKCYKKPVSKILDKKLAPNETLYEFKDYFLGEDWYIVDPVGGRQAFTIIVYEILKRYSNESLFSKLFKRRK